MRSALFLAVLAPLPALADPAEIVDVRAVPGDGGWTFHVTVAHGDTGWDDYADGWRIEDAAGAILGTRVLHHPHVEEQPFTRSLSGVAVPEDVAEVMIRSSTNVEGWAAESFGPLALPDPG